MGLLIKRAIVGLVAIISSVWSVAEVSLFAVDTFAAEEDEQALRDESYHQLMLFAAEIDLRAARVDLMDAGPDRDEARGHVGDAMEKWVQARDRWLSGEYYNASRLQDEAQSRLYGDVVPAASIEGEPWLDDLVASPAFPYITVGVAGVIALASWAAFMAWQRRHPPAPAGDGGDESQAF